MKVMFNLVADIVTNQRFYRIGYAKLSRKDRGKENYFMENSTEKGAVLPGEFYRDR